MGRRVLGGALGITAELDAIDERLARGFRVIIATDAGVIPIGWRAPGR
jgi:hypothetical protein